MRAEPPAQTHAAAHAAGVWRGQLAGPVRLPGPGSCCFCGGPGHGGFATYAAHVVPSAPCPSVGACVCSDTLTSTQLSAGLPACSWLKTWHSSVSSCMPCPATATACSQQQQQALSNSKRLDWHQTCYMPVRASARRWQMHCVQPSRGRNRSSSSSTPDGDTRSATTTGSSSKPSSRLNSPSSSCCCQLPRQPRSAAACGSGQIPCCFLHCLVLTARVTFRGRRRVTCRRQL